MLGEFWRNVAGRSKRKIVYTALTAGYDRLLPPAIVDADIDYLVYTDAPAAAIPPPIVHCNVRASTLRSE